MSTFHQPAPDPIERNARIQLFDAVAPVTLTYRPVLDELHRRETVGMAPLPELDVLKALMGLPVDHEVRWGDLTAFERSVLPRAPRTALEVLPTGRYVRRATTPLEPLFVLIETADWRYGLGQTDYWARFCAGAVLLPEPPENQGELALLQTEATSRGVGVYTLTRTGQLQLLAHPRREPRRHTAAQWQLAELILHKLNHGEAITRRDSTSPADPSRGPPMTTPVGPCWVLRDEHQGHSENDPHFPHPDAAAAAGQPHFDGRMRVCRLGEFCWTARCGGCDELIAHPEDDTRSWTHFATPRRGPPGGATPAAGCARRARGPATPARSPTSTDRSCAASSSSTPAPTGPTTTTSLGSRSATNWRCSTTPTPATERHRDEPRHRRSAGGRR